MLERECDCYFGTNAFVEVVQPQTHNSSGNDEDPHVFLQRDKIQPKEKEHQNKCILKI